MSNLLGHPWVFYAILLVGYLQTALGDTSKIPINVPDRYKPILTIVLGQLYGAFEAFQGGSPLAAALWHGVTVAFLTLGLDRLLVQTIFNGQLPPQLAWIALIDPNLAKAKAAGALPAQPLFGRKPLPKDPPAPPPPPKTGPTGIVGTFILVLAACWFPLFAVDACTPQQAQTAETIIADLTGATCTVLEQQPEPAYVYFICNLVEHGTGGLTSVTMKVAREGAPAFAAAHRGRMALDAGPDTK